jgi:hypothetical protein
MKHQWSPEVTRAMHQFSDATPAAPSLTSVYEHRSISPSSRPRAARLEPEQHIVPAKEIYVSLTDSPPSETRNRRRLVIAAAVVVAVSGIAAIAINFANADDDPSPAVATVAPPTSSTPTTVAIATTTEPVGVPGALPDGTYRIEVTNSDLDAVNFHEYVFAGTWQWTFLAGHWSYQFNSKSSVVQSTYKGTYIVDKDHISMVVPGQLWNELYKPQEFTWKANPDGSLQFTALFGTHANWAAILASHPLVKTS